MLLSHDTEPAVFGREEITLVVATVNHFDDKVENKHISSLHVFAYTQRQGHHLVSEWD